MRRIPLHFQKMLGLLKSPVKTQGIAVLQSQYLVALYPPVGKRIITAKFVSIGQYKKFQ